MGPPMVIEAGFVRPRVRTRSSPSPVAETVAVSRGGTNRDSCPAVFPATPGTHRATGPVGHRQEILRPERRCVSRVSGRRNSVRDRAVVAPLGPCVLNACATALWRSGSNGVT